MDMSSRYLQPEASLRILIPFREVLLHYILLAMMFIATTTLALQLSKDTLSCVAVKCLPNDNITGIELNETCELLGKPEVTEFLNSECLKSYGSFFMFYTAVFMLSVFNMCLVLNPRCYHTLQQFVKIVRECYECNGTQEQILSVLQSSPRRGMADEQTPLLNGDRTDTRQLSDDSKTRIETMYDKVKTFGDLNKNSSYLKRMYFSRAIHLMVIPVLAVAMNIIYVDLFNNISPFKCIIDNQLPIAFDYALCSRHMALYFIFIHVIFLGLLFLAFLMGIYSQYHFIFLICRKINVPECCGQRDLAFLCYLLKEYSEPEHERFILFYSAKNPKDTATEMEHSLNA